MRLPLWECRCNLIRLLLLLRCAWGTGALCELRLMPTRVCNLMYMVCLLYYQPRGNSSLCNAGKMDIIWTLNYHCACCLHHHHVAATCLKQAWFILAVKGLSRWKCVFVCLMFFEKIILCHVLKEPLFLIQSRTLLKWTRIAKDS